VGQEAGWAPQLVWTQEQREKISSLHLLGTELIIHPTALSLLVNLCDYWPRVLQHIAAMVFV
jgi:hypothetical protein